MRSAHSIFTPLLAAGLILAVPTVTIASTFAATQAAMPVPEAATLAWLAARIVLLAGFLFAVVAAFKVPGTGIPEFVALVLMAALVVPAMINGDARWYELLLILTGLVLVSIEIFILPGFGATGLGGIVALGLGFLLVFLPATGPNQSVSLIDLRNALAIVVGGGLLGIVSFALMSSRFPTLTGSSRLVLRETNAAPMPSALWPVVGDEGIALTDLKPGGSVSLPDAAGEMKRVDVVCKRGFVAAGAKVVVTEVVGQVITVKPDGGDGWA